MTTSPFGRLLTAMVTPFSADGALDVEGAQRLASYLVDEGCDGLVISGTTGESPTTTDEEKDDLLRAVVEAVGDRAKVVAGVGTNDTAHSVELAQRAHKAGAHGLLVVTPYYNKPPQAGLIRHFTTVADATALPVMLYDIPGRSGVPIATETLIELSHHDCIVAVKDAKANVWATTELLAQSDMLVFSGDDAFALPWFAIGAVGLVSVTAHVAAARFRAMLQAVDDGDLKKARDINEKLVPAIRGIMMRTQGAISVKAAMSLLDLPGGPVRSPLVDMTVDEIGVLEADLRAAGIDLG